MKTWVHLQNPFLNATAKNFLRAMNISTFHDSALASKKADPVFLGLYNGYHPVHVNYKTLYDDWVGQGGEQQGETLNLYQLLALLSSSKIEQWDIKIQNVYPRNTPAYKKLLPGMRQPFQKGQLIERVEAVQVLKQSIGDEESLAAVKTDVTNFNTLLQAALSTQKEKISATQQSSTTLETARVAMCVAQFGDLGSLISKYPSTPEIIEDYFDIEGIRNVQQIVFTGHVKGGEVYTILRHTFANDDQVVLTNQSDAHLQFYLAPLKDSKPGTVFVSLDKGIKTVSASELGIVTDTYLTVLNSTPSVTAEFKVELK
jgi:hypothetical protein